jgi:hypothetical protein
LTEQVSTLTASETALKDKVGTLELSRNGQEPAAMLVKLASENAQTKLAGLVTAGKITPACKTDLETAFIGESGATIALSLKTGGDTAVMDKVIAALGKNDPVKLTEQSKAQDVVALSHNKDKKDNPLIADAKDKRKKAGLDN